MNGFPNKESICTRCNKQASRRRKKKGALERAYLIIDDVAQTRPSSQPASQEFLLWTEWRGVVVDVKFSCSFFEKLRLGD